MKFCVCSITLVGPKKLWPWPRPSLSWGPRSKPRRAIAEDDHLLGTSPNAQRKERTECMGQGKGKSRQHSNTEYGVLQAHTQVLAHAPFQQLPTTLGMGRLDRTIPKKVKLTRGRKRRMEHQYKRRSKQRYGGTLATEGFG